MNWSDELGLEPSLAGPQPTVLPLHYSPMALVMGVEPTSSTLTGWRRYRLTSPAWNPMQDSNPQPLGPWPSALNPIELMGHWQQQGNTEPDYPPFE